jgi:hypothetical protein
MTEGLQDLGIESNDIVLGFWKEAVLRSGEAVV